MKLLMLALFLIPPIPVHVTHDADKDFYTLELPIYPASRLQDGWVYRLI